MAYRVRCKHRPLNADGASRVAQGQRIEGRDFSLPRSDGKIQTAIGPCFEKLLRGIQFLSMALAWNGMLSAIGCLFPGCVYLKNPADPLVTSNPEAKTSGSLFHGHYPLPG